MNTIFSSNSSERTSNHSRWGASSGPVGGFRKTAMAVGVAAVSLSLLGGAQAEQLLLMNFKGTLTMTSPDAKLVHRPMNSDALVSRYLENIGVSNASPYTLVFHQDSSDLGDTIEVVNKTNGVFACGVLRLYFQEHFERADGTLSKRFAYGYNYIHGNSFGTAILNERTLLDKQGHTNRFVIDGSVHWYWTNAMEVWSGTFTTGKPLLGTNAP